MCDKLVGTMMCKKHNVMRGQSHFVFVEDCTYYLSSHIFKDYGLEVRSVRTDSEGIVVEDLERQLLQCRADTDCTPLFLYTIPLFNNPTGRCISSERKLQLLRVTAENNLLVVSDEVYQMLDSSNHLIPQGTNDDSAPPFAPLRSLLSRLDLPQPAGDLLPSVTNVLAVSSFSKILAPGLRVGWIRCSTQEQATDLWELGLMRSGSSTCHFTSCMVSQLLQPMHGSDGPFECLLENQIVSLSASYARRYAALTEALVEHSSVLLAGEAGGTLEIEGYKEQSAHPGRVGGYFVWVRLPHWCGSPGADPDAAFNKSMSDVGLIVRAGAECTGNGVGNEDYIRLCFAR